MLKRVRPYIDYDNSAIISEACQIDLRHPVAGRKYVQIGKDSLVDATLVFETETGRINIGERSVVGGSTFISRSNITIGNDVTIAAGSFFYDHDSHSVYWEYRQNDNTQEIKDIKEHGDSILNKDWEHVCTAPITIKDKAWIGINTIILKGVTIGEGAVVGAGSVVTKDVPDWCVAAGNPAKVVKKIRPISGEDVNESN